MGNFLIKRVVENLRRELPKLDTFVTLSPVPGFAAWLARELTAEDSEAIGPGYRALAEMLYDTGWAADPAKSAAVQSALTVAAAYYFLRARNPRAKPVDPVARFHLGNGAGRERINFAGDLSASGMRQARGLMVNYLYKLDDIEANHEAFVGRNEVVAAPAIQRMLRQRQDRPQRALVALCGSEGAANAAGGKGTRELTS